MRLLAPTDDILGSWIHSATWYQQVSRLITVIEEGAPGDLSATMRPKLDAMRDALEVEAVGLLELYGQGARGVDKRVASLLPAAWAEVKNAAIEPYASGWTPPSSVGGLGQAIFPRLGWVPAWLAAGKFVKWIGGSLLALWVFDKVGIPVLKAVTPGFLKGLWESDKAKAAREAEGALEWIKAKNRALEECARVNASEPAKMRQCVQDVNDAFNAFMPDDQACGMLDTPTGTGLGGIFGLLGGYVTGEAIIGKVE